RPRLRRREGHRRRRGRGAARPPPPLRGRLVLAVLAIAQQSGEIVAGPDLISRGVMGEEASPDILERARGAVLEALAAINPESRTDPAEVKEEVRKALRRYFKRFDRRPVILPFVMEM